METKLKPFDLEAAKAGAKVVTRNGEPVRILCFDRKDNQSPIVGLVSREYGEGLVSFTKDGKYFVNGATHCNDLFMAPEKHEGWVVIVGEDKFVLSEAVYETREEAEEDCKDYAGITVVKVEWEE